MDGKLKNYFRDKPRNHANMTYKDIWTFLSMIRFLLCTSLVAAVDVNFQENIALNKSVNQSSNLIYPADGHSVWSASNAVDGNKDCSVVDKDHYSGTAYELVPWWQVDLGNIYALSTIVVYGRHSENPVQLKGFQVYLLTSENIKDKQHIYNNTNYGNGVISIPVQQNVFGRYVRIEMSGNFRNPPGREGSLVLCEVEVYAKDIIQKLKDSLSPSMSSQSTYDVSNINWNASRAIDSVNNFLPNTCSCCSGTNGADVPWWRLRLPKPYLIAEIMIYGRSDSDNVLQSSNLFVYGSNSTTENGTQLYHGNPNRNSFVYSISLNPPRLFQILTIRRWIIGLMTICEVKLFQAGCLVGAFGDKCLGRCNCRDGVACDVNTGYCESCRPGFKDDNCQTPCDDGKYGQNCSESCSGNCKHGNQQCNKTNGNCMQGCADGYVGIRCEKECDDGTYGQNCFEYCSGHCKNGNQHCKNTNGYCMQGCDDGYMGIRCTEACPPSTYGHNCTKTCNTCTQRECRNTDGLCSIGCAPGYKPTNRYCNEECDDGQYGQNCSKSCSWHCKNGNHQCIKANGNCMQGCSDGYLGDKCENNCPPSKYGENCTQICSYCEGLSCNNTDGLCLNGCVPGYTFEDPYCKTTCPASTYDTNCSRTCSTCADMSCINTDGLCLSGCVPGYTFEDSYCSTTCPPSTYGHNCTKTCNTCTQMECRNTDGLCSIGCVPGFKPTNRYCTEVCDDGQYGQNCSKSCSGHCKNGNHQCLKANGNCMQGCADGYTGDKCENVCNPGRFGLGCSQQCNCINNTACRYSDGRCYIPECKPGWTGDACDKDNNILDLLRYKIKTSMSTTAGNWTSDRAVDGNIGPDPNKCQCCSGTTNAPMSWWMVDLGERVPVNGIVIYSRNNENDFRQLQGFQVILSAETTYNASSFEYETLAMFSKMYIIKVKDNVTRYIRIQRPGVLTLCEVKVFQGACELGKFGQECAHECYCADSKPCNQVTGHCQSSACKTGWQGPSCNESCPPETFGDNCSDSCYCAEGTCTNNYGICPGKCRQGYHGPHCNEVGSEVKSDAAGIVGAVCATCAFLVVAVIIGIVVLKFRRTGRNGVKNEYETPNRRLPSAETQEYDTIGNVTDTATHDYVNEAVTGL